MTEGNGCCWGESLVSSDGKTEEIQSVSLGSVCWVQCFCQVPSTLQKHLVHNICSFLHSYCSLMFHGSQETKGHQLLPPSPLEAKTCSLAPSVLLPNKSLSVVSMKKKYAPLVQYLSGSKFKGPHIDFHRTSTLFFWEMAIYCFFVVTIKSDKKIWSLRISHRFYIRFPI